MASTQSLNYHENKKLGRLLQVTTALSLAVLLVKTRYWLVELKGHDAPHLPANIDNALMYALLGMTLLVCMLFLLWFKRAHSNADLLNNNRRLSDSSKVALWAILPGVNLLAPFYNMFEIFSASFRRSNHIELITAWWLSTLIYIFCTLASLVNLGEIYNGLAIYGRIYSGALAHVTLFTIVTMVTMRQARKSRSASFSTAEKMAAAPQEFKPLSEVLKSRNS